MNILFSILFLLFILPMIACADVVWPGLYIAKGIVSWQPILAGLVVELYFVMKITKYSLKKSILVDFAMNGCSAIVGIVAIPVLGLIWEVWPGQIINEYFHVGTFNILSWAGVYLLSVLLNTYIESLAVRLIFKFKFTMMNIFWLFIANLISIGLVLIYINLFDMML